MMNEPFGGPMIDALTYIIIFLGFFITAGWIVWVDSRRRQASIKTQSEFRHQLLEKFGSSAEFTEFLKTEEGQRFLNASFRNPDAPLERIVRSIQVGVVLVVAGAVCSALNLTLHVPGLPAGLSVAALATGVGLLVSSAVAHRLSKAWRLIPVNTTDKLRGLVTEP
jgi:hypothetical protein